MNTILSSSPISLLSFTKSFFSSNIILLNKSNELQTIIKSNPKVIVDFFAKWCGPCRKLTPQLESLSSSNKSVTLVKVNVDNHSQLVKQYKVKALPTVFFFKNGKLKFSFVGIGAENIQNLKNNLL